VTVYTPASLGLYVPSVLSDIEAEREAVDVAPDEYGDEMDADPEDAEALATERDGLLAEAKEYVSGIENPPSAWTVAESLRYEKAHNLVIGAMRAEMLRRRAEMLRRRAEQGGAA
jgi:hypothetical protein